jgi:hypothetical protein
MPAQHHIRSLGDHVGEPLEIARVGNILPATPFGKLATLTKFTFFGVEQQCKAKVLLSKIPLDCR